MTPTPGTLRTLAKRMAWQHGEVEGNVLAHHNELCEAAVAAADAWEGEQEDNTNSLVSVSTQAIELMVENDALKLRLAEAVANAVRNPWTYRKCGEMILANEGLQKRLAEAEKAIFRLVKQTQYHPDKGGICLIIGFEQMAELTALAYEKEGTG